MNNTFFMCMLNGGANLQEQFEALSYAQFPGATIFQYRNSANVLKDEKWPAILGFPGVQKACDVCMRHQGKSQALAHESFDNGFRLHALLEYFDGDLPPNWLDLFAQEDLAHCAFTETGEDAVLPDERWQ